MIKHVFINKEKIELILAGDKTQLRQPVGFCYDDGKPRTMFVGTKRDAPEEVHLTQGGDLQFNLKPAREEQKEEVKAPPADAPQPGGEPVDLNAAPEGQEPPPPAAAAVAQEAGQDADIPF
jgi:hypothetical protein